MKSRKPDAPPKAKAKAARTATPPSRLRLGRPRKRCLPQPVPLWWSRPKPLRRQPRRQKPIRLRKSRRKRRLRRRLQPKLFLFGKHQHKLFLSRRLRRKPALPQSGSKLPHSIKLWRLARPKPRALPLSNRNHPPKPPRCGYRRSCWRGTRLHPRWRVGRDGVM